MSEKDQYEPRELQEIIEKLKVQLQLEEVQPWVKRARETAQEDDKRIRDLHQKDQEEELRQRRSKELEDRLLKNTAIFRKKTGRYTMETVSMALLTVGATFILFHTGEMTASLSDPIADVTRVADIGFTIFGVNRGKHALEWGKLEMRRMLRRWSQ